MTHPKGIAGRILDLKNGLQARLRVARLTNVEFGRMVAEAMGRAEPFGGNTVKQWIDGDRVPELEVIAAIAALGNVSAGYLAFGESSETDRRAPMTPTDMYEEVTSAGAARKQKPPASVKKRRA